MMAFDSNMAPIVGQQITRSSSNGAVVDGRLDLLRQRADAGECDLVAKGRLNGEDRGALYVGGGLFVTDRAADPPIDENVLRGLTSTPGQELTFTCVPPGSGARVGIDRDADGFGDRDELDSGSDPANAASLPAGGVAVCTSLTGFTFKTATLKDSNGVLSVRGDVPVGAYAQENVAVMATDDGGTIFSGAVAGASIVPKGSGFKYKAPKGATGITRVYVKEKKDSGGLFRVTLRTKKAWTAPAADEDEPTTFVVLNVGGECFRGNATRVR